MRKKLAIQQRRNQTTAIQFELSHFNDAGEAMTSAYGRFALGTHEWQKAVATVNPAQPIKEVSIQLRFDGDNIGTVWFDSVRLQEGRIINRATYDSLFNYQTRSTDPAGNATNYQYDTRGNQTKITDPKGQATDYTYDLNNQLKTVTLPVYDVKVQYEYDENGNTAEKRVGSKTDENKIYTRTTYLYDDAQQLKEQRWHTGVKQLITSYTYNARGDLQSTTYPSGNKVTTLYDSADRPTGVTHQKNGEPSEKIYEFTLDANGNRTEQTYLQKFASRTDLKGTTTFTYDALNQITSETVPHTNKTIVYTYDPRGNRTKTVISKNGTTLKTINHNFNDLNQLTDIQDGTTMTKWNYDDNGNLLDDGRFLYEWDADNRLRFVKIKGTNADIAQYWYDEADRRIRKDVGGTVTNYVYEGDSLNVLYETLRLVKSRPIIRTIRMDNFWPTEGSTRYYYHYNARQFR
ncbi:hypothetical protein [Halalkalibacter alkalisediminis]|uniref:Teneurin-like YD-shell domain-containing protein n=1 Tax=Halalkalibacter alkalisediminis TaxID=935616 RepID=A0ABV6NN37_9BACI